MAKVTVRQFLQMSRSEQYEVASEMTTEEIIKLKDEWERYEEDCRDRNRVAAQIMSARSILKKI